MSEKFATALYRIVCGLVPPEEDSDHRSITMWRFKILLLLTAMALVLGAHLGVSHGIVGSGFASNSVVQDIQTQLMEDRILQSQERYCQAWSDGNISAQRYSRERRERLRSEYRELTGYVYQTPTCEELGYSRPA
jgi:hypothetical protein